MTLKVNILLHMCNWNLKLAHRRSTYVNREISPVHNMEQTFKNVYSSSGYQELNFIFKWVSITQWTIHTNIKYFFKVGLGEV